MNPYQETELKLRLADPSLYEQIAADPYLEALRVGGCRESMYDTVYYDTAGRRLLSNKLSLRLRNTGEGYVATVKGAGRGAGGGLVVRGEWNKPLENDTLTVETFADMPVGPRLAEAAGGEALIPVVRTVFKRIAIDLQAGGALVEFAADRGEIQAGDRSEPLCEVELELKCGDVEGLLELGRALSERWPLEPEKKSKYHRGLLLSGFASAEE